MLVSLLLLVAGVALAGFGGELFVRGAVGLAARARVPAGLVGATVAAFATSTPELSVGIQSATSGRSGLALGDALGSNVVNVAVVLGIVLVLGPLRATRAELRRDLGLALVAPLVALLMLLDGRLGRAEGVSLLVMFVAWVVAVGRQAMGERSASTEVLGEHDGGRVVWSVVGGLVALVAAGRLVVMAATGIGDELGLDPFVVGATLVALGTSTPEIATAVIARRRGHSEVGVGTVLGSNVFNTLWIVGIVAVIQPVRTQPSEVALSVLTSVVTLLMIVPTRRGVVPRERGVLLLAVAALYGAATVAIEHGG